tara:strand:+ start:258 stop:836 length:579 start_codon:yes stop_codon:yes gene_type:complete
MTNEEKDNILDQHKTIYDGYVTSYAQQPKEQPLYTQDFANDKEGITVSNKGVVTSYKNMGINEMRFDGKSTGLFSSEEPKEGSIQPSSVYTPEESFESEDKDDEYYVSLGEHLDMIGDGEDDLEHGVFGHEDDSDMVLISPEIDFDDESDGDDLVFDTDSAIFNDIDDEEVDGLFDDLNESLDMFKRFTKYN